MSRKCWGNLGENVSWGDGGPLGPQYRWSVFWKFKEAVGTSIAVAWRRVDW